MTKTEQLNKLFKEWKKAQINESEKDLAITIGPFTKIKRQFFCEDGIIDEETYDKEQRKVLFLTNEPNIDEYLSDNTEIIGGRIQSFVEYYDNEHDDWRGKMRERICGLYQAITNDFSKPMHKYARSFAFMNLNKRGGGNVIGDGSHLKKYCELYSDFILKEIEIINPDIIIWLGTKSFKMDIKDKYLNARVKDEKYYLKVNNKDIPLIGTWHTSYTRIPKKVIPMTEFDNIIIGRQATHLKELLAQYGLS